MPSDLILAAASGRPTDQGRPSTYMAMRELPACLDAVEPLARAVYATGWRRPYSPGPTAASSSTSSRGLSAQTCGALRRPRLSAGRLSAGRRLFGYRVVQDLL